MRRVLIALIAVAATCVLTGPALADVTPVTDAGWHRWGGADRYATAVAVSRATFAPGVPSVYLVSGENYPDALAAGPVAGANESPILLTTKESVPPAVAEELRRLNPGLVIVVGGTSVITDSVKDAAGQAAGASTVRSFGEDRYATAVQMANTLEEVDTAYIASGETFADALSAGAAAGAENAPLLLTHQNALPPATRDYLSQASLSKVVIVGGPQAISPSVEATIRSIAPSAAIQRLAGRDRYDTARRIAEVVWPNGAETVFYAPGSNFPDALGATPAAMVNQAPVLLTTANCHPYETTQATERLKPIIRVAVGGSTVTHSGSNTCGPTPTYPFMEDLDCKDFPTQAAAQSWFNHWYPRVGDIFRLDRDNDRKVCEVWPPR